MRSSSGRPEAWYFFAIETTRRRLDWTNVRCAVSPSRTMRLSSRRRVGVIALRLGPQLLLGAPTGLDRLGKAYLVVLGEQRILTDVGQIQPDEIFLVALNSLFRQGLKASVGSAGTAPRCPK